MSDGFEWLDWLEPSGPFLAAPVLKKAFPQGLDTLDSNKRRSLRQAYDEYRQALDDEDPDSGKFQAAWIDLVLKQGLEYDEDESGDNLKAVVNLRDSLVSHVAEHGVTLKPDYAVVDDQSADKPMMLIQVYGQDVDLNDAIRGDGWASSPRERMVRLCRDTDTRLGIVTNGEHWLFVDAPVGAVSSFASWYARLWGPEPVLLQAFVALLGIRRFFVAEEEQLPALIDKSVEYQDEVTEALGEQVRRAVEVLIQALDKADVDRNRELLKDVDPRELYEAGLTVMMRLVFLLSAEERELLLLGDERYEANYAVSTLRMQLRGEDDAILQRRWDAWSRLLAIFRAIYGGIEHETLRMPALGGSLFNPDRFPFLEGRDKNSSWKTDPAKPLPIDNQTVLLLLDAIQLFEGRTLSYRGLDIEQLGYVYEGLLDHTVKRANEVTLELNATKSAKQPWVTLGELESARLHGEKSVENLLKERMGSSISRVRNDLKKKVKPQQSVGLLTACHNDQSLHDQLEQYFHLIRTDSWGRPLVYPEGSFMVTTGEDRRQTGSHYTPTSLTEAIVRETLEPVVYVGPAEGKPREEWRLRSPEELLDLKICDPTMGSGAFLVQVCRWLGERVVEAWAAAEQMGKSVTADGEVVDAIGGNEALGADSEERILTARRLIAERCIYGVDVNPLAVELAKLSIWLITLAKGRPFGFLDHSLRSGDSLLGVNDLNQLLYLSIVPEGIAAGGGSGKHLFAQGIEASVNKAITLRQALRDRPIRDIRDVQVMAHLDEQAIRLLQNSELIADALIGEALVAAGKPAELADRLVGLSVLVGESLGDNAAVPKSLEQRAAGSLAKDTSDGAPRLPFHWPLAFPEVFSPSPRGFDAIVGNVPFLGGSRITGVMGTAYRNYLVAFIAEGRPGKTDLAAFFFLRAYQLLRVGGVFGLLATNTIAEGDTRQVGLEALLGKLGAIIFSAYPSEPWPGKAAVVTSRVHINKRSWRGAVRLNDVLVPHVSAFLSDHEEWSIQPLKTNDNKSFLGSYVHGRGYTMGEEEALEMIVREPKNSDVLFPYLGGRDLNTHPEQKASRWVINFFDWPEERAKEYAVAYQIVLDKVKPEREKLKRLAYRDRWWQYAEKQSMLYHVIGRYRRFDKHPAGWDCQMEPLAHVLVNSKVGKYFNPTFVSTDQVFQDKIVVMVTQSFGDLALLNSSLLQEWVWKHSSRMKMDLSFTPKKAYRTLPFPEPRNNPELDILGRTYDALRVKYRTLNGEGTTDLYNRFHDPSDEDSQIVELRVLLKKIDEAVVLAYGWSGINLEHSFYNVSYLPENDRMRFTISDAARLEVLQRLSALNRERYEEEVEKGLHGGESKSKKTRKAKTVTSEESPAQPGLDFSAK